MRIFILCLVLLTPAWADTLDFESLADLDPVTNQFAGLTFSNTIALASGAIGGSLAEFEFPPMSGDVVVSDDFAPITIDFDAPVTNFRGFFTYVVPLTLEAFDASDSLVASAVSLFSINTVITGDAGSSPNELLELMWGAGISRVVITGDAFGNSFTLDDAEFFGTPETATAVLEPMAAELLMAVGIAAFEIRRRRRQKGR